MISSLEEASDQVNLAFPCGKEDAEQLYPPASEGRVNF